MLYRKTIVSTRTLFQLTVILMFLGWGVGAAFAATGVAPILVPYTITSLAGNTQYSATGVAPPSGFGGDNQAGLSATLQAPGAVAVDSVGNVYIADTGSAIIRELNAQTGILTTIAGINPSNCIGTVCTKTNSGCADGVPALRSPIGSAIKGMAVDAYGNVYFSDQTAQTISVIYRGGAQVANFIALEDPTAAPTASAVLPGYVYHIGGTINLATCAATVSNVDNVLAFQGASMHSPGQLGIDSAGNVYVQDVSNNSVRVINAQSTTQTFFQYDVPPGYMRAIANCSATLTAPCQTATLTSTNEGINGPANAVSYSANLAGMGVDGYGNVYELISRGCSTNCYGGVAYAGGAPLAHLINLESGQTATYGNFYNIMNSLATGAPGCSTYCAGVYANSVANLSLRPVSINADALGNLWFWDTRGGSSLEIVRIDVNNQVSYFISGGGRGKFGSTSSTVASTTNPQYCVYGTTKSPFSQGPQTTDPLGDGCPSVLGAVSSSSYLLADGPGNVYLADGGNFLVREITLDNSFPATPVATPVTQAIQVHFDGSNVPVQLGVAPNITTTAFSIAPGIPDFTINTTTPEFAMGTVNRGWGNTSPGFALVSSIPTCAALSSSAGDPSLDCLVYVTFTPSAPGLRQAELLVTTQNGGVYNFSLSGVGSGGQLVIDGGQQTVVPASGLGKTAAIAVSASGAVYIADPDNNRVVVEPAGGGTQTTIGTGLSGPKGVAVDAANNVYISDTGNNRILKVNPLTGTQTVLGASVAVGSPAYPQYSFNGPQGLAVDSIGNVYVADTGNAAIVEITSNPALGGAVPLLAYPGAPKFFTPVAVAVDSKGNVYVADQGNLAGQIVRLPPGGGDLVSVPGSAFPLLGGNGITSPNGVAVDGGGNVYISDSGTNTVWEAPAKGPPNGNPFILSFTGLNTPGGLALDAYGNLFVSDSGNKQVLTINRQNPLVSFGTVPQDLASPSGIAGPPIVNGQLCPIPGSSQPCTGVLTVTNIGTGSVTLTPPFTTITNVSPAGDTAFNVTNTCGTKLDPGTTCTISPTFYPTSDGPQSEKINVNGSANSIALVANTQGTGANPLVNIVLSSAYSAGGLVAGQTATITATVTQPNIPGNIPSGSVTFTYAVDANAPTASCGAGGTVTVPLTIAAGKSTASFPLPVLAIGRNYTINATYNNLTDNLNSPTLAAPLVIQVPGVSVTATANSITYAYGQPVPPIVGVLTGVVPSDNVTYTFTSQATSSSPVTPIPYPITVSFTGGNYCNYGFPQVLTSTGVKAVVTETTAPLTVVTPAYTAPYGAEDFNFFPQLLPFITGAVNGDLPKFSATFTPAVTSILDVGTYTVVPTLTGKPIGNYTVKVTNGTLTVTSAPTTIGVSATSTAVLPSGLSTVVFTISVSTLVTSGLGTPAGTVTLSDTFVPIIAIAPGTGTPILPCSATLTTNCNTPLVLPLVKGLVTYTPTTVAATPSDPLGLGTHYYSFAYSGDSSPLYGGLNDFKPSATLTTNNLLIDNADFTVTSTTGVIAILPGIVPSGNGLPSATGQSASSPETAVISINAVLSEFGVVALTCQPNNPSYVSCKMTPPQVTLATTSTTACSTIGVCTSVISISTPATLPLGFFNTSQVKSSATKTVLAFLPFGVLAFCVRRRRRLSKVLLMLLAMAAVSAGMSGCGGNKVDFFTPVPQGPDFVTVTATGTSITDSTTVVRTFIVPISID